MHRGGIGDPPWTPFRRGRTRFRHSLNGYGVGTVWKCKSAAGEQVKSYRGAGRQAMVTTVAPESHRPAGTAVIQPTSEAARMPERLLRGVPERLRAYQTDHSHTSGLCARAVMLALNAPPQGAPSAAAMWQRVPVLARREWDAPRGSIVYWTGGSEGYGHVCFALGGHMELSVDVLAGRPGVPGVVPFDWFRDHWPNLVYRGWSWYWGSQDTRPANPYSDSPRPAPPVPLAS